MAGHSCHDGKHDADKEDDDLMEVAALVRAALLVTSSTVEFMVHVSTCCLVCRPTIMCYSTAADEAFAATTTATTPIFIYQLIMATLSKTC